MCLPMDMRGGNPLARDISDSAADTIESAEMEVDDPTEVLLDVLADVMSSLADEWLAEDGVILAKMLYDKMHAEYFEEEEVPEGVEIH